MHRNLRECSKILDCVSQCVYLAVSGCMTAQTHHECKYQRKLLPQSSHTMDRDPVIAQVRYVFPLLQSDWWILIMSAWLQPVEAYQPPKV